MSKRVASQSKVRQTAAPQTHVENDDQYDEYIYYQYEPKKNPNGAYDYVPEGDYNDEQQYYDQQNSNVPMQQQQQRT